MGLVGLAGWRGAVLRGRSMVCSVVFCARWDCVFYVIVMFCVVVGCPGRGWCKKVGGRPLAAQAAKDFF